MKDSLICMINKIFNDNIIRTIWIKEEKII